MVRYQRETLLFYSIVGNTSHKICELPEHTYSQLSQFGLEVVKAESQGLFQTYGDMCDKLQEVFRTVSCASIAQEEEGSVVYLIRRDSRDPEKDQVLSLSKLKTLEYRLFRKMREKLRNQYGLDSKGDAKRGPLTQKFKKEA